jgi:chemotaxis protein methyltransferase CheR
MPIGADIIAAVSECLADHAGLELPAWLVEARVTSRIAALAVSPASYVALITSPRGASELARLIEAVRVGESRLFRHRAQIAALVDDVVPALRARGKRAVKIWSAGCSTGQEAYTLATVLDRTLPGTSISILATDVSAEALAVAREARYPMSAYADIPEEWRDAFVLDGDEVCVRPAVADLVTFEQANLLDGTAHRGFDIVWCRNVLIYFTEAARQQVIDRLVAATVVGGCVFAGYSESLREVTQLKAVRAGEAVYYVKAEPARASSRDLAPARPTPPPAPITLAPPQDNELLVLDQRPTARDVAAAVSARLAIVGLRRLVVDLDPAELLDEDIASTLTRARAAARAAGVELVLKATRAGTRRWLARNALDTQEGHP